VIVIRSNAAELNVRLEVISAQTFHQNLGLRFAGIKTKVQCCQLRKIVDSEWPPFPDRNCCHRGMSESVRPDFFNPTFALCGMSKTAPVLLANSSLFLCSHLTSKSLDLSSLNRHGLKKLIYHIPWTTPFDPMSVVSLL
jgi:hypothetical protein